MILPYLLCSSTTAWTTNTAHVSWCCGFGVVVVLMFVLLMLTDLLLIASELLWKVARYTSAAPVFFTECDGYVDGGVVANNPCNYGLTRIKMHLRDLKEKQKRL